MRYTKGTQRTQWFIGALSLLAALWEYWTIRNKDESDTISAAVWHWAVHAPWLVVLLNFVSGLLWSHFFVLFGSRPFPGWALWGLGAAVCLFGASALYWRGSPFLLACAGFLGGILLTLLLRWQYYEGKVIK